ncbi:MAG: kynureninase, partial [Bacteroidia bacterium]|nr:kynureninase [Bacteroidia bacterium]
ELNDWANLGVEGHFAGKNPWMYYHHFLTEKAAKIVGAKPSEVVIMNNLTANLHLMMVSFYRPTKTRYKIIMEGGAFPSDQYAMETQAHFHHLNPDDAIIELKPREGEYTLRTEDIIAKINEHKNELAIVMMGGVNYYTGQAYDMQAITKAGHAVGANVGFDCAHAAGNLQLQLHNWDVDFAVWCTYKYLNSGPGGTSGVFVHERHGNNPELVRFAGWWGHDEKERFKMKKGFVPMQGAAGWQLSNAQIFPMAIHKASLELFDEAGIENLRAKSETLTAYLEFILNEVNEVNANTDNNKMLHAEGNYFTIITPKSIADRGCQLSIIVKENGKNLFDFLETQGIMPDWREPDVIRLSPVPMYNSFEDVYRIGEAFKTYFS